MRCGNADTVVQIVCTFQLCSPKFMIALAAEAYAPLGSGLLVNAAVGRVNMPAYIHHLDDTEPAYVICPSCVGIPMYIRDVEPHWSMAKIEFTYECADCGAEVRQTVVKPESRH